MAEAKIGQVAFVDKGTFNIATIYSKWDFVVTADSTYLYIAQTDSSGHEVTNTAFWKCLADGKPATLAAAAAEAITETATAAETLRVTAENTRVSQENGRVSAENSRVSQENTRQTNETGRISNESTRVTNETARNQNETNRTNAETTRVSNESTRVSQESGRVTAESSRVTAESGRFSAESGRVTAESGRVSAEQSRVSTFNSQMSAASTATTNAQNAANRANASADEVDSAILSAGFLGTIAPTDAAPTPARNGFYKFSVSGAKPSWLTALSGVTNVMAGDEVGVTFTAPSTYTYIHIPTASTSHSGGGTTTPIYLSNVASAVSGYKKLSYTPDVSETTKTIVANNNTVTGEAYLFDLPLDIENFPAGQIDFSAYASVSTASGNSFMIVDYFLYLTNGTETPIYTATSTSIEGISLAQLLIPAINSLGIAVPTGARFGMRIRFQTTHNANVTLSYIVGNGRAAWFRLPIAMAHSQLRRKNEEVDYQHVTSSQVNIVNSTPENFVIKADESYVDDVCMELEAQGITIPTYHLKSLGAKKLISKSYINPLINGSRLGAGMTQDAVGNWIWADHNLFLNSKTPASCTITTIVGAAYSFSHSGAGSIVASGAGSGTSTNGSVVTITATTTSLVLTCSGVITRPICCYGSTLCNYVETSGAAKFPLRYNAFEKGFMFWGQTTNLVPNNQWVGAGVGVAPTGWTVSNLNLVAPGTLGGWPSFKLVPNTVNNVHYFEKSMDVVSGNNTISFIVKSIGASSWSDFIFLEIDTNWFIFNFKTGVKGASAGLGAGATASSTLLYDGSYRVEVTFFSIVSGTYFISILAANSLTTYSFAGNNTDGIEIALLQLETGTAASPPIPTYGASATCAADTPTVPLTATGLSDAGGCVVARFRANYPFALNAVVLAPPTGNLVRAYPTGSVDISDATNTAVGDGTYADKEYHTCVTSYGQGGLTSKFETMVEGTASYDGTILGSTYLWIGDLPVAIRPLNGYITELWTIPTQPNSTQRTKLAALWT